MKSEFKPFPVMRKTSDKAGRPIVMWVEGYFIYDGINGDCPDKQSLAKETARVINTVMSFQPRHL
jgi:hypothetical protein